MEEVKEVTLRDHLISRGMDVDRHQVIIDEDDYIATFLLFNLSGRITGYQRYNPNSTDKKCNDPKDGRYYTYTPRGVDALFGLETIRFPFGGPPLFIVEGAFKQATLARLGYDALAVLTSDPKRLRPLFRILRTTRPVVAIGDNDPAGQKLVNRVGAGSVSPADIDEMNDRDVVKFVEKLTNEVAR